MTLTEVNDADMALFARAFKAPDTSEPAFMPPIECVLDVPVPPSVNETRKVYWPGHRKMVEWRKQAGFHLLENGQFRNRLQGIGKYELTIILDESQGRADPDNLMKASADFLKSINVILDDSRKYARRIVVEFGSAPAGVRLIVKPCE